MEKGFVTPLRRTGYSEDWGYERGYKPLLHISPPVTQAAEPLAVVWRVTALAFWTMSMHIEGSWVGKADLIRRVETLVHQANALRKNRAKLPTSRLPLSDKNVI